MKSKNKKAIVLVVVMLMSVTLAFAASTGSLRIFEKRELNHAPATTEYVPDEILVKFKPGARENAINKINSDFGTSVKSTLLSGTKVLKISSNKTVEEMVETYCSLPEVEYAEPNYIAHAFMVPNDPFYSYQWHLDNDIYGGINMEPAWDISTGTGVVVAVLDTGVAYENYSIYCQAPDLAGTTFVPGYDFVNNDAHPNDDEGHGTHVAGTIAQTTNNDYGVAGVAFDCSIMPVKVLNETGYGAYSWITNGIYYATDNGADVISMSLGGPAPSSTLEAAVAYAYNNGVTVVAAAGNEYQHGNPPQYPAAYDDYVIAVGATRYDETRSYYSNTGDYLDLTAPGGDITVDQNGDGYGDGVLQQTFSGGDPCNFGFWFYQGTSMATPHVSGVAALLIANGVTGPDNVRNRLESTAEDKGIPGWDEEYGWGLVNATAALRGRPEPDLVVEEKWEDSVDGGYVVNYTIHNRGNATAPAGHYTTLYVDEKTIEHRLVPVDLEPCETYSDTFDTIIKCTPPSDVIKVCADNYNNITESNEENNCIENEGICECEPSIEVNKTVWSPEKKEWVNGITADLGDIVRFRCEIQNNGTCCNLTQINVTDILSESLGYANNATVNGESREPEQVGPNEYQWEFQEWVLEPCETITIEFDAKVVAFGGCDINIQRAKAWCAEMETWVDDEDTASVCAYGVFDTEEPKNPYPSIFGTHNGTITPNVTIYNVSRLYTYPCAGTGGHSESVAFYDATTGEEIANGTWNGYQGAGDYHYIEFNVPFDLQANVTYNYTIRTGSYPQIHHNKTLATANGWINCTKFTDVNGKEYTDWIPAIRLE